MRGLQAVRSASLPVLRTAPSRSLHTNAVRIGRNSRISAVSNVGKAMATPMRVPGAGFALRSVPIMGLKRVLGRRYQSGAAAV